MSADDPGRTHFEARMRRVFAGLDTTPGFEARVMQRVAAQSPAPRTDLRAQFERARAHAARSLARQSLDECRDGGRHRRGRDCRRLASPAGNNASRAGGRCRRHDSGSSWSSRWPSSPPEFWPALRRYVTPYSGPCSRAILRLPALPSAWLPVVRSARSWSRRNFSTCCGPGS